MLEFGRIARLRATYGLAQGLIYPVWSAQRREDPL
jgi:hypothetical protein